MSFGKRLKLARMSKKLTQVEVANKLGIDDTTISKYENDKSEPDNETLVKLLDLYGVNFDYVHGREHKEPSIEETELERKKSILKNIIDAMNDEKELDYTAETIERLRRK